MKKHLLLIIIVLCGLVFTGCKTAEGFGKDMEDAGEAIQDEVN